mgnify:CR=1 FL=1
MIKKLSNNRYFILYFLPFLIGSLTIFSFSPYNLIYVNLIIFPIFFYLIIYVTKKSKSIYRKSPHKKNLFLLGLFFGFGFYFSNISWITHSLTFDENFKILIPFAKIVIPLFLSLFTAFTVLLIGERLKLNFSSLILFSASLAITDFLRAKLFTGFPWNLWAYSTYWLNEVFQILNFVGLHSYNLFVITVFTLPIIIFFKIKKIKKFVSLIMGTIFVLSLYIFGDYKINRNIKDLNLVNENFLVKIISPNFELKYGLTEKEIEDRFRKLIRYSDPDSKITTLFIWPEGVFAGYSYDEISKFKKLIKNNFSKKHFIIVGANKLEPNSNQFYNSMYLLDNNFEVIQSYDKKKLVPFGEFLPFESFLNKLGFKKITEGHGSFLRGVKSDNLFIEKLNILPLICYEVIFTELVQKSNPSTNLIVNISEDGWFGNTIGPDQHFSKSIFRAVESNTFFLRSANKGVSAIIDNKGNIVKQLGRNETGSIEFIVPLIKSNKNKNDLIFFFLLITYLLFFFINKEKNAK